MSRVLGNISTAIIGTPGQSSPQPHDPRPPLNPGGSGFGIGIKLNGLVIGGVKRLIEENDILDIPSYWEYNVFALDVDGEIYLEENGVINVMGEYINYTS